MRAPGAALAIAVGVAVGVMLHASGAFNSSGAERDLSARAVLRVSPAASPATAPSPARATKPPAPAPAAPAELVDVLAVTSAKTRMLTLADAASGAIVKSIDIGGPAQSIVMAPDGRHAWVFSGKPDESEIAVVDVIRGERRASIRVRNGPRVVAFSSDGRRAYVAASGPSEAAVANIIVFLDAKSGTEFGRVELGKQTKGVYVRRGLVSLTVAPGANGDGDILYAASPTNGTVWAVNGGSGEVVREIEVGGAPMAVLADPASPRVYALTEAPNQLVAIDTSTQEVVGRLDLPALPSAAAMSPDGRIFITAPEVNEVWTVEASGSRLGARFAVGQRPTGVAVSADGSRLFVSAQADGAVSVVDVAGGQVLGTLAVGDEPRRLLNAPRPGQTVTPTPTPTAQPNPTATPTIVPKPTPLPEGAPPPEHMPDDVVSEAFVPEAAFPVAMAFAPDGRLFYNELRTGKIRIVQDGQILPDAFYAFGVSGQPEAGLLGLALDPEFESNHYVYVFYTSVASGGAESGGPNGPNQLVRLTEVGGKGTNLTPILQDLPSAPIHNGGSIRFGPDGKLYVSLGDTDEGSHAQNLAHLPGKILRINADGSVPQDNPFVEQPGAQPAIWAYGLRNPFSFDFHPVSRAMLAVENGPGDNDELNLIERGANYGWPLADRSKPGLTEPLAVINPPIAPSGSTVYAGDQIPGWKNDWFYCNYHQGQLRRVHLVQGSFDRVVFEEVVKKGCSLAVATGPDGALYYSDIKGIYRMRRPGAAVLASVAPQSAAAGAPATPVPTASEAEPNPEDRDLNVTLSEWKVAPSRARVPTGGIRFLAENVGATPHALRIVGSGLDVSTDNFRPGQARSLSIVLPAGTYQLICPVPGHPEQGMVAELQVLTP
jgi:glucose/arabinose dehydrogenase/DNA-binding beta-propeller fold protein YncE